MFYDNLKFICEQKGLKITPIVLECGGTKGVIGGWKKGATPNSDIVMKLAVRLNVPTDLLLFGKEKRLSSEGLSDDEQELLNKYKKLNTLNKGKVIERAEILFSIDEEQKAKGEIAEMDDNHTYVDSYSPPASAGVMVNLDDRKKEMLEVFQKFNDGEQIKLIGKLEELYRQKQIKECVAHKVARASDGQFRRTEISKEELERIDNLPEDNDI